MENADASRALRNHCDAVILPGLTIEALGRVQGAILRDRDVGHILLIDDKEASGWRGRASSILRKYLADVRASHVLSRVEHQWGGGRSPAINGRRLFDEQTNGISPGRRLSDLSRSNRPCTSHEDRRFNIANLSHLAKREESTRTCRVSAF